METFEKVFLGVIAAIVLGTVILVWWAISTDNEERQAWREWCQSSGGRVETTTEVKPGPVIYSGKVPIHTTTTEETDFCLTDDGRILGING